MNIGPVAGVLEVTVLTAILREPPMSSPTTFRITFVVASIAWFAFALDKLVVATALPNIRVELGAGPAALEWTVNAFTLTFAVLLLTGSALGDRFGRRRLFVVGMALFTAASALAGLAPSMELLVAARALQGAGGALFAPVSLTLLSLATPPARRGTVFGLWGGVGAIGAAIGPLVGGLLTETVGWRSAFWLNVPLGLIVVALAWRGLDESYGPATHLDVAGVVLGTLGLLGVVGGVIASGEAGWAAPHVWLSVGAGLVALGVFLAWERRAAHPILPVRLFRNRTFTVASVSSLLMYAATFGSLFFLVQLFQTGLGESPLQAGLHTMPIALMPMLLSPVGGWLSDRLGVRPLIVGGLVTMAAALGWFAVVVSGGVSYRLVAPGLLLMGTGAALFFGPITAAVQGAVSDDDQGRASGAATTVREVAAVLGIAVIGAAFSAHGGYATPELFVSGLRAGVIVGALIAAIGTVAALALPRKPLKPLDTPVAPRGEKDVLVTTGVGG